MKRPQSNFATSVKVGDHLKIGVGYHEITEIQRLDSDTLKFFVSEDEYVIHEGHELVQFYTTSK